MGHGRAPQGAILEWRLRDIEQGHLGSEHGCEGDVRWLVLELRRHREALVEVLTRCQDAADVPLARDLQHVAVEALGIYKIAPAPSAST
jgi:hypothetical protein